ncbi:NUDIX hydrolase [Actibacterium pelagium]|uniref:NUDIX hydrolase n=1 Tax=Actibacterium pelagium TaxID=2029103 RepID=A0A917AIF7_9RHOB|nr:NUDIX hydrolase [Actibacterium pelagium]GGE55577.1 NUDIX hydrolase [Actibacterium pelagium]
MRRFGEPVKSGQKYILRPGVYAVLPREGSMLVTHQMHPYTEVQLPGGGIDPGESPLQALHREVLEETGWRIAPRRRLGAFRRFTFMPEYEIWAEKLCHIYLAQPVRKLADPTEPFHTALWMPSEDAVEELGNAGDRHFAASWLNG